MFFNRYQRIKTQAKIGNRIDDSFLDQKTKLKIKNIRFTFDHNANSINKTHDEFKNLSLNQLSKEKNMFGSKKKTVFVEKLPELAHQIKDDKPQLIKDDKPQLKKPKKIYSLHHHKKKDAFLNSILQILQPDRQLEAEKPQQIKSQQNIRWEATPKSYNNEFFQEVSQLSTTKHHRSPKIIENDFFKFKNSTSIAKRKIFSESKERSKVQRQKSENHKQQNDLEKIQILTFSNKFPLFKKTHNREE